MPPSTAESGVEINDLNSGAGEQETAGEATRFQSHPHSPARLIHCSPALIFRLNAEKSRLAIFKAVN